MTAHLAHAGLLETIGLSLALFVLAAALLSAVLTGGGASGRLLAQLARHCWRSMRRPHRRAHRARRPHPRMAAAVLAARYLTRHTIPGGTSR